MIAALAILSLMVALVCTAVIGVEAFADEFWKGLLCIVFPPYLLYFAFTDFEHDDKWWIVIGAFGGYLLTIVLGVLFR